MVVKKVDWFLLCSSAVLYALPFLFSQPLWWLIFFFPIPLLYITRTANLSFMHGYVWGIITFALHLSGGIYVIACMAGQAWWVGVLLGIVMVLYQALSVALLFWCAALIACKITCLHCFFSARPELVEGCPRALEDTLQQVQGERSESWTQCLLLPCPPKLYAKEGAMPKYQGEREKEYRSDKINDFCSPIVRLCLWTGALAFFIIWTDRYSLWIFGIKEGYPLMHPLIPLAQHPQLLSLLPIFGKPLLTLLLLLVPASCVALLWFKNGKALFVLALACLPWLLCWYCNVSQMDKPHWLAQVQTIPYMCASTAANPVAMMKSAGNEFKKIIEQYPTTTVIIMPESAFNCSVLGQSAELLRLWSCEHLGKAVHLIFGTFRYHQDHYYNTAYWVYNGQLQQCFDKRHAMMVSERLSWFVGLPGLQDIYFGAQPLTAISSNERVQLSIADSVTCVPYICSELFFNEYPDDAYSDLPIVALMNDTSFVRYYSSYILDLLVLVARLKAIAWQRDIIYVSYTRNLFINRRGISMDLH